MTISSTSSSPDGVERLLRIALVALHPHPLNSNQMSEERLEKLARNIEQEGRYPPLVVRPHPQRAGEYQLLDGHQRTEALRRLGHEEALCFVWPCADAMALRLLATFNRLEGEDIPVRRAELLNQLSSLLSPDELALLLPEDAGAIRQTIGLLALDSASLIAELEAAANRQAALTPRAITFAVLPEDEAAIEAAVARAVGALSGPNRRGRAIGMICRDYMEKSDA